MAINPNPGHPNKNTLYLACSGGGKSQALKQNIAIPKKTVRHLLWDIDHDHKASRYESMKQFKAAVIAGIKSGRGFRIAFSGDDTVDNFEMFCAIAWAILDGKKTTFITIEELADVTATAGKASPHFGRLLRKGRKFGMQLHATSQRGAEISKTVFTQCPIKYIGIQEGGDIKSMAAVTGVSVPEISGLNPLEFFKKTPGAGNSELIKIRYRP